MAPARSAAYRGAVGWRGPREKINEALQYKRTRESVSHLRNGAVVSGVVARAYSAIDYGYAVIMVHWNTVQRRRVQWLSALQN